jgi:hypothetical protein
MRWGEAALFMVPFALFAVWRLSASLARPYLAWGALTTVLALAIGAVLFGLSRRVSPHDSYVPAHMVDGKIIPGQGVAR